VEAADRLKNGGSFAKPVKIGDDVWIGLKANILPGSKSRSQFDGPVLMGDKRSCITCSLSSSVIWPNTIAYVNL